MQKFFRILLIIFLFIVCLLLGANFANITLPGNNLQSNFEDNDESQIQILLFLVDNFDNRKPQLQSIWSINLYWQDAKGLMFIPLTDQTDPNFNELKKSFILTPENELNDRTQKFFNTKFETKWNATIVLDEIALQKLLFWVTSGQLEVIPNSQPEAKANLNLICTLLSNNIPSMDNFDWASINPTRFKSNMSINQMINIWSKFYQSEPLLCEIINN